MEVPDMTVDNSVDGHVVIVTGASKGVGRGIALHLARSGASLVITARKPEALEATAAELGAIGAPHLSTTLNVADREGAFALVERTIARFGRVDGLVANAQTFRSVTPFAEITEHDIDVLLNTGPKGTLWGMQAVFPHMRDQGRGRIVTMGSNAALLGAVGYAPYASSKEAIRALTRSAAREWGTFGITVNCLCPVSAAHRAPPADEDPERARMFAETYANQPIPRDGDAEDDIGPVVQFLLSDASRYMTGQTLMADGGAIMLV
jgi:NAD(P)-dependent dehydrogenase (short-subunit alcohol dehydrogenase family)